MEGQWHLRCHFEIFHIHPRQFDIEDLLKVLRDRISHPGMIGLSSEEFPQGGNLNPIKSAGCDEGIVVHIGRYVKGEAVIGHPPRNGHPDGGDLGIPNPGSAV